MMLNEQIGLYSHADGHCCNLCDHYSALVEPRERSDGSVIYGYCFKSGDKDYSPNMGKGFPVFIDGAGASCKAFKRRKKGGEG